MGLILVRALTIAIGSFSVAYFAGLGATLGKNSGEQVVCIMNNKFNMVSNENPS